VQPLPKTKGTRRTGHPIFQKLAKVKQGYSQTAICKNYRKRWDIANYTRWLRIACRCSW